MPVHFSLLIPRMSAFTLAVSCLTTSNLPWFVDLTFQVPMQYCSLQHGSCFYHQSHHQFSSVQSLRRVRLFATPWITARQASLCITNSRSSLWHPSSQWCHPAISSSVIPFSSCPQSLPASKSFPMSQLFTWGGQSVGVSGDLITKSMC